MKRDVEVEASYWCASEAIRSRRLTRRPIPYWLQRHFDDLDLKLKLSRGRQETVCAREEFEEQCRWIGTSKAAELLGWTTRQVQRLASDLDGQLVSGRWMFRESTVLDYAEAKRDGDSRSGAGGHARSA